MNGQGERDREGERDGRGADRGGPQGTEFLDLEISRVLAGEAEGLARQAAREIIFEALKARLRERLGDRLDRLGRLAADELADDVEANLGIEAKIAERKRARQSFDERLRDALIPGRGPSRSPSPSVAKPRRR